MKASKLIYQVIYLFSKLPLSFLYKVGWIIYVFNYYIIGYRKEIVQSNIKDSFPNQSKKELKKIEKQFYKNFSDYLMETIRSFSISMKELSNRTTYINTELLEKCKNEGKNVMLLCGHIFNWEWLISMTEHAKQKRTVAIYHKIRDEFWDQKIKDIRSTQGTELVDMKETTRFMMELPNDGNAVVLFVADQSPKKSRIFYDLEFLNQDTPVFSGFDNIARKYNMAVIYCDIKKIKQGYYETTLKELTPTEGNFQPNELVHKFYEELELNIQEDPANWLWTHKRWKYKKGIDY